MVKAVIFLQFYGNKRKIGNSRFCPVGQGASCNLVAYKKKLCPIKDNIKITKSKTPNFKINWTFIVQFKNKLYLWTKLDQ
jgi:hypothetical protein